MICAWASISSVIARAAGPWQSLGSIVRLKCSVNRSPEIATSHSFLAMTESGDAEGTEMDCVYDRME